MLEGKKGSYVNMHRDLSNSILGNKKCLVIYVQFLPFVFSVKQLNSAKCHITLLTGTFIRLLLNKSRFKKNTYSNKLLLFTFPFLIVFLVPKAKMDRSVPLHIFQDWVRFSFCVDSAVNLHLHHNHVHTMMPVHQVTYRCNSWNEVLLSSSKLKTPSSKWLDM